MFEIFRDAYRDGNDGFVPQSGFAHIIVIFPLFRPRSQGSDKKDLGPIRQDYRKGAASWQVD